jgi:hypothetical protein
MGPEDRQLNRQKHGHGKIHKKSIAREKFQFSVVVIISPPDLNQIPQDKKAWDPCEEKQPVGRVAFPPHHFNKGKPGQDRQPDVEISHPLLSKPHDQVPFSNGMIRFFIGELIDQDHVEDGKADGDGEQ